MTKNIRNRQHNEIAASSQRDYEVYGTELTRGNTTMDDIYGDGSDHEVCLSCGLCKTCGDCESYGCGTVRDEE